MIVLIPAYEPDHKLAQLVDSLCTAPGDHRVLVVNDGSDPRFEEIFDEVRGSGATVIEHHPNRGKGHALKRGFAYISEHFPSQDVVCADSDGQHTVSDIFAIAAELRSTQNGIVLGARGFTGDIPLRSRFGNSATRMALRAASGLQLQDTQTGLRAYPAALLRWLGTIEGDRFEYELNVLLQAKRHNIAVTEVPIATIYIDDNASSHFRPLVDSVRVYLPLVKFAVSSLTAGVLDFVLVLTLVAMTGNLALSVVFARICSATVNFTMNRQLVFDPAGRTPLRTALTGYGIVAVGVLIANYVILHVLYERLGVTLALAKLATDVGLFGASYILQKHLVFVSPDQTVGEARFGSTLAEQVRQ